MLYSTISRSSDIKHDVAMFQNQNGLDFGGSNNFCNSILPLFDASKIPRADAYHDVFQYLREKLLGDGHVSS